MKLVTRRFLNRVIDKPLLFLGTIIVSLFANYLMSLYKIGQFQFNQLNYSIADGYVNLFKANQMGIFIVLPFTIFFAIIIESDFQVNTLIRMENRKQVFVHQLIFGMLFSIILAVVVSVANYLTYVRYTSSIVNWQEKNSVFMAITGMAKEWNILTIQIIFILCFVNFLMINFTVLLFSRWIFHRSIYGIVIIIALIIWDLKQPPHVQFLYRVFGIDYFKFTVPYILFIQILLTIIFLSLSVLTIVRTDQIKRCDFYDL